MGCAASRQVAPSYAPAPTITKSDGPVRPWHNSLPRSVSIHSLRPQSDVHDDPAVTGSFVRLLYRKKPSTPSAEHNKKYDDRHHRHQQDLGLGSDVELSSLSHPTIGPSDISHHFCRDGYSIGSSLQQPQLAALSNWEVHKLHVSNGSMVNLLNEGLHDEHGSFSSGMSSQYLEKPTTVLTSVVEISDDSAKYGGDEQVWDNMNGMEGGRRDDLQDRGVHDVKQEIISGKSLSFNTFMDTQTGALVWPGIEAVKGSGNNVYLECSDSVESVGTDVLQDDISTGIERGEKEFLQKGFSKGECPLTIGLPPYKLSSPFSEDSSGGPKLVNPVRSPSKSPILNSKSLSSPLFDPSLLALFEQAAEGMCHSTPMDGWILDNDTSDVPSRSLSSSDNLVWTSLEDVSSDADSLQIMDAKKGFDDRSFASIQHGDLSYASMQHGHLSLEETLPRGVKRQKFGSPLVMDSLEMFELRCPPRGEDRVVLYFTTLRGIRKTYQDCCALQLILQGLGVDVDERDVWMHMEFRQELRDMLGHEAWPLPRLFIRGRYIGGAEKVKQMHEDGILGRLIKDLPTFGKHRKDCDGCADMRFVPCLTCHGSCKLVDYELDCMVRCMECNENGLIMCPICCS